MVRYFSAPFPLLLIALGACGLLAAPGGARADDSPAPEAKGLNPRALGVTEAVLEYCAKAHLSYAEESQSELRQGASPEILAKVRAGNDYRQARAAEEDFLSKVDPRNARRICAKSAAASGLTPAASRPEP